MFQIQSMSIMDLEITNGNGKLVSLRFGHSMSDALPSFHMYTFPIYQSPYLNVGPPHLSHFSPPLFPLCPKKNLLLIPVVVFPPLASYKVAV